MSEYALGMVVIVWVLFFVAPASPARTSPERLVVVLIFAVANTAVGAVIARLTVNLVALLWSKRQR